MAQLVYTDKNGNSVALDCESVRDSGDGFFVAGKVYSWTSTKSCESGSFDTSRDVPVAKGKVQSIRS